MLWLEQHDLSRVSARLKPPVLASRSNTLQHLRVALVASSLKLSGAEKQTAYPTRALIEAGLETRFFYLGEGGHYEGMLRRMGLSFVQVYRPNRPIFILTRLTQAFRRFRPEIVFMPQFGDLLQGGTAGRRCNALVLGGLRSDGFYELNTHGRRSRWMLRLSHGLVANSHCAKRNLVSRVADSPKIAVLPNVLDLSDFDARSMMPPPISIPSDRVMAVAVGRLQPSKRFDRFLRALALARQKAPGLLGVIAGSDCGSGNVLAQQAVELGLAPNHVVFLGECQNVPALLAQAGFLVLCSEYEGFPNVILEAMAANLSVIATRVGDAERIVLPDRTGYLVEESDVEALAERMVALASSPATRIRLGTEGRRRVAKDYNYESLPVRLLSVFHDFAVHSRRPRLVESLQRGLSSRGANPFAEAEAGGAPWSANVIHSECPVNLP
jgi:glycosyltransferase involved in cell wall biosynthesis